MSTSARKGILLGVPKKKRRRLDADAARELILDATEKRLVTSGPSGIRLQEVAADAGVSHPTVLHHFGSREQLVKAVIERSIRAINASLVEALNASSGEEEQLEALIEHVAAAFEESGHARVVFWLALEGHRVDSAEAPLSAVVDAAHALRLARFTGKEAPSREDTARTVVLAALALMADSVVGPTMLDNAGLGSAPRVSVEFRRWLARLLIDHLDACQ